MLSILRNTAKRAIVNLTHLRAEKARGKLHPNEYGLDPELWDMSVNENGHLTIAGNDSVELAKRYGTPLYVIDKNRLHKNYQGFYESFRSLYPHIVIGYSYKTNPLPGVLKSLHEFGAYAEVISEFELWLALQLNVAPQNIIFNGPSKTAESLQLAVANNIGIINIDNMDEIDQIDKIAQQHNVKQKVGVRVVTSVGWSSQFGLAIGDQSAFHAFEKIKSKSNLIPCGIHFHLGTGLKNVDTYIQAIKEVLEFAKTLKRDLNIDISYFDLGGGFGVATVRPFSHHDVRLMAHEHPVWPMDASASPSLKIYSEAIVGLVKKYYSPDSPHAPTLIFEPGRAITSSAQSLLLSVLAVKKGKNGVPNVILDGGKNITMPLAYEYHEIFLSSKMDQQRERFHNLYGPLCHPSDIIFLLKKLPNIEVGDNIAIMDAGAYFVPNQMNFSNPRPAAVLVDQGEAKLIRKRESFADIVRLDESLT